MAKHTQQGKVSMITMRPVCDSGKVLLGFGVWSCSPTPPASYPLPPPPFPLSRYRLGITRGCVDAGDFSW